MRAGAMRPALSTLRNFASSFASFAVASDRFTAKDAKNRKDSQRTASGPRYHHPNAGCPRADPGPLPVLISSATRIAITLSTLGAVTGNALLSCSCASTHDRRCDTRSRERSSRFHSPRRSWLTLDCQNFQTKRWLHFAPWQTLSASPPQFAPDSRA